MKYCTHDGSILVNYFFWLDGSQVDSHVYSSGSKLLLPENDMDHLMIL